MSLIDLAELLGTAFSILSVGALLFAGAAISNETNRLAVIKILSSPNQGAMKFEVLANGWVSFFEWIFGSKITSKRQLITIPIYTFAVAGIFFCVWIIYLFIFQNPTHSLSGHLPLTFIQGIKDYYHQGFWGSLLLDVITIQMTKLCIAIGRKRGFQSISFYLIFFATLIFVYFVFSLLVLGFRTYDMVRLYTDFVPNDQMFPILYNPIKDFSNSLNLFSPVSLIYVTSKGWVTTYFMPEPLIFYCAVVGQFSLIFWVIAYQIAISMNWINSKGLWFLSAIKDPVAQAKGILALVTTGIFGLLLIIFVCGIILFYLH